MWGDLGGEAPPHTSRRGFQRRFGTMGKNEFACRQRSRGYKLVCWVASSQERSSDWLENRRVVATTARCTPHTRALQPTDGTTLNLQPSL